MNVYQHYISAIIIFLSLLISSLAYSQVNISKLLEQQETALSKTSLATPLKILDNTARDFKSAFLKDQNLYRFDHSHVKKIKKYQPKVLRLDLGKVEEKQLQLDLVAVDILASDFKLTQSAKNIEVVDYEMPLFYWGKVSGDDNSLVAISISDHEIAGTIAFGNSDYTLGRLKNSANHILYNLEDAKSRPDFICSTDDATMNMRSDFENQKNATGPSNCVNMYIEVDHDIFLDKGSMSATIDFITGVFSQVAILFNQESINFKINELKIWNSPDPYTGPSSGNYLDQFQSSVSGSFNGDLAHLVGYGGGGGVAYVDVICNSLFGFGYTGISSQYNDVPSYSWTVGAITHEIGHNLGSPHTHACAWNGNSTAIDGCGPAAGYSEGCNAAVPASGTIMSYCHLLNGVGINFNNGFGQQPGDLIRNNVYNNACLSACGSGEECTTIGDSCDDQNSCTTNDLIDANCNCIGTYMDVDGDGYCIGDDPDDTDACNPDGSGAGCATECTDHIVLLNIDLDNYPRETSWRLFNANNQEIASGANYSGSADVNVSFCLIDGCYRFVIYDSYGDGVCCGYGQGAYSLTSGGETLASGGQFGSSETSDFCLSTHNCPNAGDSCDDENACTTGDSIDADCNCTGVYIDADDDGICVGDDPNDNDPCVPDTTSSNCTTGCEKEGQECDDNDDCTIDDIVNENCDCVGAYVDQDDDGYCVGEDEDDNDPCVPDDSACDTGGCSYSMIDFNDFESGWGIWNDGGADCRRSANDNAYAESGSYCVRLRDNTSTSVTTTDQLNLSGYEEIRISFSYVARSMDNANEDFWLQMSTNGGSSYLTVEEWNRGDEFENFERLFDEVIISGPFSNNTKFRFRCDASGNSDWVYLDDIKIEGCGNTAGIVANNEVDQNLNSMTTKIDIFPNPISQNQLLNISFAPSDRLVDMMVLDYDGKLLINERFMNGLSGSARLSINDLPSGTYLFRMIKGYETFTKKFVVIK